MGLGRRTCGLVARAQGYSILNLKPQRDTTYDGGRLTTLPIAEKVDALSIVMATLRDSHLTQRARAFAELCETHFQELSRDR